MKFQGFRPWAHGDYWDEMTPRERRIDFAIDCGIAGAGLLLLFTLCSWIG